MMKATEIVVVGAGNMATRLSIALVECGYTIVQVYSRTIESARLLASRLGEQVLYTNNLDDIYQGAGLYIFSISDSALPDVVSRMPSNNALWVHTAGSMPMEVLALKTPHYGVLYPMQTVSRERDTNWSEIPIFVEASTPDALHIIEQIATSLSTNVKQATSQQRKALHLAAVFACNFSNHMYAIAEKLLQDQGLDFDVMKLLIRETERKAEVISPRMAQTGPAVRNDVNVMEKHLQLLQDTHEAALYTLISENIDKYKKL